MSEEFRFSGWVSEGIHGIRNAIRVPKVELLPAEFHEHLRSSRKEFLLAFRSLFDAAVENLDKPKATTRRKAAKIKVE